MKTIKRNPYIAAITAAAFILLAPREAYAMHIMEGFLPLSWALLWWAVSLPFLAYSVVAIKKITDNDPGLKMLLGVAGAFTFVLSALKLPSVTGSSSHPTGVGLGAVMFGPAPMTLLGAVVLLFQATLMAHGGLTTLGANIFSMAVAGPFAGYGAYRLFTRILMPRALPIFFAAFTADLATYAVTSVQLALAHPAMPGGVSVSLYKFLGIFAVTQVPLAVAEGILTVLIYNLLMAYDSDNMAKLRPSKRGV